MNPVQFLREQAEGFKAHLLLQIETTVSARLRSHLQEVDKRERERPRAAGVMLLGEGLFSVARRRRDTEREFFEPEEHAIPPVRKAFISGASFSLVPGDPFTVTFHPNMPVGPGASIIAWGSCVLEDAAVGTESVALWPGNCPVMLTTRACNLGMIIRVQVRGVAL